MKLAHTTTGKIEGKEERTAKSTRSAFTKYLLIGATAFAMGIGPSCGSNNPDSVINIPPLSDGGTEADAGPTVDGGDGGSCVVPTPTCSPQSVTDQTLNVGDTVVVDGYKFSLTGTDEVDGNQVATFDVLDACDEVLSSGQQIGEGDTKTFHIQGTDINIVVSVSSVTVLDPKTAKIDASVSCENDGGVTDGGNTSDGGAGGSDAGAGGDAGAVSDGGSAGSDGGVVDGGAGGTDGGVVDSGTGGDGGSITDGGVSDGGAGGSDGGVVDGGAGADGGVVDGGVSDGGAGGSDGGVVDAGAGGDGGAVSDGGVTDGGAGADGGHSSDAGVCGLASTGSFVGTIGIAPRKVGGYVFSYDGPSGSDSVITITCGGSIVESSFHCPVGSVTTIDVPSDGKVITIEPYSATLATTSVEITVADL